MFKRAVFSVIALYAFVSAELAYADALSDGNKAYERGDYEKARRKWIKSNTPEAWYNLGLLSEQGRLFCKTIDCTISYYKAAADKNLPVAMIALGRIYVNQGHRMLGVIWFQQAARWNNQNARDVLAQMGESVPGPDLWNAHVEAQRQAAAAEAAQRQQSQDLLALGLLAGITAWSATQQGHANYYQNPMSQVSNLVGQRTDRAGHHCDYMTPSGKVTVTVGAMMPCPSRY